MELKVPGKAEFADLSMKWIGLDLKNPVVAESAGYTVAPWGMKRLIKMGCSAIVTKSTTWDPLGGWPRQWDATPQPRCYWVYDDNKYTLDGTEALQNPGHKKMTEFIKEVKPYADQHGSYIVGSFSPRSADEATIIAREFEKAGAAAIHMDLVCPSASAFRSLQYPGKGYEKLGNYWSESPERLDELLKVIRDSIDIPLIPKTLVGKWLTKNPDVIPQTYGRWVDGFSFMGSAPVLDIDLYSGKQIYAKVEGRAFKYLTFRMVADIARLCPDKAMLPSGGIQTAEDIIKCIMLGSDVGAVCTAIYRGPNEVEKICQDLETFMVNQAIDSLEQIKGVALKHLPARGYGKIRADVEEHAKQLGKEYQGFIPGENPPAERVAISR